MGTFEDQIAAVSVALIFASTVIGWVVESRKNRAMREKEYAELIRSAASTTVVKIERWKELSLRFYQDLQPLIVQAHSIIKAEPLDRQISGPRVFIFNGRLPLKEQPIKIPNIWWKVKAQPDLERELLDKDNVNTDKAKSTATRHALEGARRHLYEGVVQARAVATQRILDEQIEMAYRDLYGYDIGIYNLFVRTLEAMRYIDRQCFRDALIILQDDILLNSLIYKPGQVGDFLRDTVDMISLEAADLMEAVIVPFREEMMRLICAKDHEIYKKSIEIHGLSLSSAITSGGPEDQCKEQRESTVSGDLQEGSFAKKSESSGASIKNNGTSVVTRQSDPLISRKTALCLLDKAMKNIYRERYVDASANIKEANESYKPSMNSGLSILKDDASLWSREGFDIRTSGYKNAETDAQICYRLSVELNKELVGAWAGMALAEKKNGFVNKRSLIEKGEGDMENINQTDDLADDYMKKARRLKDKKSIMTKQDAKTYLVENPLSSASNQQLLSQLISNLKKKLRP